MEENAENKNDEDKDKSLEHDIQQKTNSNDSPLSLSLTPPIVEDLDMTKIKENAQSDDSISEHISSNSDSVENDRSCQEIEISNQPLNLFFNLTGDEDISKISQEVKPSSLNSSFKSETSVISLNYLDKFNGNKSEEDQNVQSILEEILNNEQFKSDKCSDDYSKDESLNIFANVNLDDQSLSNYKRNQDLSLNEKDMADIDVRIPIKNMSNAYGDINKRLKDSEELIAVKDSTIAALTTELDSYRELSNPNSNSMVSTTEYKQLQEECHSKLLEYNSVIIYKNDLIQQLTESLDQSVTERRELLRQVEHFKNEISELQLQLEETSNLIKNHNCEHLQKSDEKEATNLEVCIMKDIQKTDIDSVDGVIASSKIFLDIDYSSLEKTMIPQQIILFNELKLQINNFIQGKLELTKNISNEEMISLKNKIHTDKTEYEEEIKRLRDMLSNIKCGSTEILELRNELEAKHARELVELRTYFEKKCAEFEKNYSEEVFSQQSRKMSGSSTCSVPELNSDVLFSNQPGPGGDIISENLQITKKDVSKLKEELISILNKINAYKLEDLKEDELASLKTEISKSNIHNLFNVDLMIVRRELQNRYHAELEIMREYNENQVDMLTVEYKDKLKGMEDKYLEEIDLLKVQLNEVMKQNLSMSSAVQEVASSGEFEINEVVQSYERRLQEQVTLAKIDIISALESQIQRLVANEADDEEWPSELLQLRDRFTDKYEAEILRLREEHEQEISKLKEEHLKLLNGALERARRRSLRDSDSLNKGELELLKERDALKKQSSVLRNLLAELLKYFTQCEDELNNTLVDELLKQGFDKNLSQLDDDFNINDSMSTSNSSRKDSVKRVHLTPNFKDLLSLVDKTSHDDSESNDISVDLKNELGLCLEKLRLEANAILALTTNLKRTNEQTDPKGDCLEDKLSSLTRQLINEAQIKDRLKEELTEAQSVMQSLEKEKDELERHLEDVVLRENVLEVELGKARQKIAELIENGHKEIVSEGYGEEGHDATHGLGDTMVMLTDLQDKARNMLSQSRASADPNLLNLIEELCRVGEKIKEESRKERLDLMQQIEAADKKYKSTCDFLEEQANERELERDEAQKKIDMLHEQLRDRERDRASCERISSEGSGVCCNNQKNCRCRQVEQLERQLNEMTRLLEDESKKSKDLELERNEAVEKVLVLREIIRDLELQNKERAEEIDQHVDTIARLKCIVSQQTCSIDELRQSDSLRDVSGLHQLQQHVDSLEHELQQLRLNSELAGSEGALSQIKIQLFELEVTLDKKTKDLEGLHSSVSTNSCSSPSEDMSIRDLIRPQTPTTMVLDECEVPLQQLARLKEKLMRHSRAEDAAIKRIRDLEMQVFSLKAEVEESHTEKDYLKKQIAEQLVLISDLQIRLDEQRIRAEHIEKQTNTSLEVRIYDLQNEIMTLQDRIQTKEKTINQLNTVLSATQKRLKDRENEMISTKDDEMVVAMQKDLEALRKENAEMKAKIDKEAQILPNLVENMISDKNSDIERLREKLNETEKLLETYNSLNLDKTELQTLLNLKNSGSSLAEVLSIIDLSQPEAVRRYDSRNDTLQASNDLVFRKNPNSTVFLGSESEISRIEKIGPTNINYTVEAPLGKPNSTEIYKSMEKRVHFEEDDEIEQLKKEVGEKTKVIKEYEERLELLKNLEEKIEQLQVNLEKTEKALSTATETFEKEQGELKEAEKTLRIQLAEKKMHLTEREKTIEILEQDSVRKDQMCLNLAREKKDLEKDVEELETKLTTKFDGVIANKNKEIEHLQTELGELSEKLGEIRGLEIVIDEKEAELTSLRSEVDHLKQQLSNKEIKLGQIESERRAIKEKLDVETQLNNKLRKQLENNETQMNDFNEEYNILKEKISEKRKIIKELEETVKIQKTTLERLQEENRTLKTTIVGNEDKIRGLVYETETYHNNLSSLEEAQNETVNTYHLQLVKLQNESELKDAKIEQLNKAVVYLEEEVKQKQNTIKQITEGTNKIHLNLVTIQNKLKETGNIIDLGTKLREEQKKNADLQMEIQDLKTQLLNYELRSNEMPMSVDEIANRVQRELDYSAQIDTNIICAVSDQSISTISEMQDLEVYKKALAKEKARVEHLTKSRQQLKVHLKDLEEKLGSSEAKLLSAKDLLEKEKLNHRQSQVEDTKLIEELRIQLEAVLDNEEKLGQILHAEQQLRMNLETELEIMKSTASKTESTEYKTLPSKEKIQLDQAIKALEMEKQTRHSLSEELKTLKRAKNELENVLRYTKEMLALEKNHVKNLEEKMKKLAEGEMELKNSLARKEFEFDQKLQQVERMKIAYDELQQKLDHLTKQNSEYLQRLHEMTQANLKIPNSASLEDRVPDLVLDKIRELNEALIGNKKMADALHKVTVEKNKLEERLREVDRGHPENAVFDDIVARCDYLFARNLRLESFRKALIWQKRYFIDYLRSHERHCYVLCTDQQYLKKHHHSSALRRFRSAVTVVISIFRMKFIVRRWHGGGVRLASKINSRHRKLKPPARTRTESNGSTIRFQVGQPVSKQQFSALNVNPAGTTNIFASNANRNVFEGLKIDGIDEAAFSAFQTFTRGRSPERRDENWSGCTPPSKEKRSNGPLRIGSTILKKEDMTPLRAPQLLAQFAERCEQIQETLGVVLDKAST